MMRILVVDDHEPTRQAVVQLLLAGGVMQVIGEAETSHDALKIARELLPDIVLLDLHLPGLVPTMDLIRKMVALKNVKVVIFASQGKASEVQDLLDAGASGYVLKTDAPALIRMALLMVSRGSQNVISPSLPRHLTRLSQQERSLLRQLTQRARKVPLHERMGLTQEELQQVMQHLADKLELPDTEKLMKWAKKHGF